MTPTPIDVNANTNRKPAEADNLEAQVPCLRKLDSVCACNEKKISRSLVLLSAIMTLATCLLTAVVVILVVKYSNAQHELNMVVRDSSQLYFKFNCLMDKAPDADSCDRVMAVFGARLACRYTCDSFPGGR